MSENPQRSIGRRATALCWVLSIMALGSGGVATFTTENQLGTGGFFVVGLTLLLLALSRRVPFRVKAGQVEWQADTDRAYSEGIIEGRSDGLIRGVQTAVGEIEDSIRSGSVGQEIAERLRRLVSVLEDTEPAPAIEQQSASRKKSNEIRVIVSQPRNDEGWRGPAVCSAAEISYRQLDYWNRIALVTPKYGRLYDRYDVVLLSVVSRLLRIGVSLHAVRTAVEALRDTDTASWSSLTILSDGDAVYQATSSAELTRIMADNEEAFFGINLRQVIREITERLADLPSEIVKSSE